MKKLILFNLLFCIVVIFTAFNYVNSKSRSAVVFNYVGDYMETNYDIDRENIILVENNFRRGMGLFEIEVQDSVTDNYYFYEVDIREDYSLIYIRDLSELHRKNKADQER
ncbi:histidine kinase [Solibacillus sp. FSL W7-1464]|uniref:histidine kinase n=1 Tax=Solibacillus sp. FSL W7-1464 TaxID=2921706 RepID=UPI0030FAFADF